MNREGIRLMTPERLGIASRRSWILSDLSFESMHQCRIEIDTETAARGAGGDAWPHLALMSRASTGFVRCSICSSLSGSFEGRSSPQTCFVQEASSSKDSSLR